MKKICTAIAFLLLYTISQAQANTDDVKSVDAIIKALYEVISGEAGAPRNWERFKNLFTADARLMPTSKTKEGTITYRIMTPDEYVTMFTSRIQTGFFEQELHREVEEYGSIAHVFSTYATQQTKGGPNTNRGINSIQLLKTADRYYIMHIFWCAESLGFTLPEKYLKGK